MQRVVENPGLGNNRHHIRTAFGDNENLGTIRDNIIRMREGTIKMNSASPDPTLTHAHAASRRLAGPNNARILDAQGRTQYDHVRVGPSFPLLSREDQAGTLIHEASHYLAGTDDGILVDPTQGAAVPFSIDQPNHGLTNAHLQPGEACK